MAAPSNTYNPMSGLKYTLARLRQKMGMRRIQMIH